MLDGTDERCLVLIDKTYFEKRITQQDPGPVIPFTNDRAPLLMFGSLKM